MKKDDVEKGQKLLSEISVFEGILSCPTICISGINKDGGVRHYFDLPKESDSTARAIIRRHLDMATAELEAL